MLSSGILFSKHYRIGLRCGAPKGGDLTGRMFPESVAECYKNHRPNVTRTTARMLQELVAESFQNHWPNVIRIAGRTLQE